MVSAPFAQGIGEMAMDTGAVPGVQRHHRDCHGDDGQGCDAPWAAPDAE
jgi:hypothetical protein